MADPFAIFSFDKKKRYVTSQYTLFLSLQSAVKLKGTSFCFHSFHYTRYLQTCKFPCPIYNKTFKVTLNPEVVKSPSYNVLQCLPPFIKLCISVLCIYARTRKNSTSERIIFFREQLPDQKIRKIPPTARKKLLEHQADPDVTLTGLFKAS